MARMKKRNRKFFGTRNHGKGNAKNRRGKGGKGGWGRAGMGKHRFTYVTVYEMDTLGAHGFSPVKRVKVPTVNLYEIEQKALHGRLEKREGKDYFEFSGKVLGTGSITKPVTVRAAAFSSGAAEKIKKAGGAAETFPQKAAS